MNIYARWWVKSIEKELIESAFRGVHTLNERIYRVWREYILLGRVNNYLIGKFLWVISIKEQI